MSVKEEFDMKLSSMVPKVIKIAEIEGRSRSSFSISYKTILEQFSEEGQVNNSKLFF